MLFPLIFTENIERNIYFSTNIKLTKIINNILCLFLLLIIINNKTLYKDNTKEISYDSKIIIKYFFLFLVYIIRNSNFKRYRINR